MGRRLLPVALYIGLIFVLSSIRQPLPLGPGSHPDKFWHVLEYAGLGLLLLRALRPGLSFRLSASWALVLGALTATLDECYQGVVPGRVAAVGDGVADLAGIALAIWMRWLFERRRRRRPSSVAGAGLDPTRTGSPNE